MKKHIIMNIFILIAILFSTVTVNAATADKVTLKTSKDNVKAGENFTITVSASSENGLNGIDATMEYDKNILEVTEAKLIDTTNWAEYDSFPKMTAMWKTSTVDTKSADIYVVTFKVKDNATQTTANIKLASITLSTNSNDVTINDITKTINITTEQVEGDNGGSTEGTETPSNGSSTSGGSTTGSSSNTGSQSSQTQSVNNGTSTNTEASKKITTSTNTTNSSLPYTGTKENIIIGAVAIVLIIFGFISYKSYIKYRNI